MDLPKTLQDAIVYFSDDDVCLQFVASLRWTNGEPVCPFCASKENYFFKTRRIWKCKHCRKQFSVKKGTIFEDSPLSLGKWMMGIWMIANCKNGISSYEIHRALGITQKSAWFMLHRIRVAMKAGSFEMLSGEVEADETFIGGDAKNMHYRAKTRRGIKPGRPKHKVAVMGVVERQGRVRAGVMKAVKINTLVGFLTDHVAKGSRVYTDEARHYENIYHSYIHEVVNHSVQYVRDNVHTNSLENYWSLLKRTIRGTYVSVAPEHLQAYVEEQSFRYNERKGTDLTRFLEMIKSISGKRLTYQQLIGYQTMV
jgi:transposase-like protein